MTAATASRRRATAPFAAQHSLFTPTSAERGMPYAGDLEDANYLRRQLITYIGNKRALLAPIGRAVETVKRRLNKKQLRAFDVFSGSGVVSRYLKAHSSHLVTNDTEDYATVISQCHLRNRTTVDFAELTQLVEDLNTRVESEPLPRGFIEELYAPKDENGITPDDRVFYTIRNARRLDNYRRLLDQTLTALRPLLLAPLIQKASVHANNGGVFKGFYKNRNTGIGQYGGTSSDALKRIRGWIEIGATGLKQIRVRLHNTSGSCQRHRPKS